MRVMFSSGEALLSGFYDVFFGMIQLYLIDTCCIGVIFVFLFDKRDLILCFFLRYMCIFNCGYMFIKISR